MKGWIVETWTRFTASISEMFHHSGDFTDEAAETNFRRYRLFVVLSLPIIILLMAWIAWTDDPDPVVAAWRHGILVVDACILVAIVLFYFAFLALRRLGRPRVEVWFQYVAVAVLVALNATNTVVGQLIGPNISVFIYACVLAGFVFYFRPAASAALFTIGFLYFYFAIGLTQLDPVLLASARLNGFATTALGFFVSVVGWSNFMARSRRISLVLRQKEELERVNGELATLASHDRLSGLLNRGAMEDAVRKAFEAPENDGRPIAIFILDLDEFKQVNDVYGHHAGDMLIREVARILTENVPPTALVSRWGGDEFLAACPGCPFERIRSLAETLCGVLASTPFPYDEHLLRTSVSIGVANVGKDFDRGYRTADRALYAAKGAGKNRVVAIAEI